MSTREIERLVPMPNQSVERMAAGGRLLQCRTRWAAAIAHFLRSADWQVMEKSGNHLDFERSTQERSVLVILSVLLGAGCWWLLTAFEPLLSGQSDQALRIARFIFRDLMFSCIVVCALTCFWACFRPRWLESLLEHAASHIRFAFCCVAGFLFIFCPLVTFVIEHLLRR
jgi:hypothetical protein